MHDGVNVRPNLSALLRNHREPNFVLIQPYPCYRTKGCEGCGELCDDPLAMGEEQTAGKEPCAYHVLVNVLMLYMEALNRIVPAVSRRVETMSWWSKLTSGGLTSDAGAMAPAFSLTKVTKSLYSSSYDALAAAFFFFAPSFLKNSMLNNLSNPILQEIGWGKRTMLELPQP